MNLRRTTLLVTLGTLSIGATAAESEAPASPHAVTGNVTFTTNYVVRGITQTDFKPAIQGTLEYAHSSGLYLGGFASNVNWVGDFWGADVSAPTTGGTFGGSPNNNFSNSLETDLYAGFRGTFAGDFSYDAGFVYYYYPGKYNLDKTFSAGVKPPHTAEVYAGLGWKWITAKVWVATTDGVFTIPDAKGTTYANLTATYPIESTGTTLIASVGSWMYAGTAPYLNGTGAKNDIYDLVDYKIGVTQDWAGYTFGAFYWGSTADRTTVAPATGATLAPWANRYGKNLGDDSVFFTITKAF
jgi:uncharacterized protein (TIGR02001 family)